MANDDATANPALASLEQQRTTMKKNISKLHKKNEKDGDKVDATILQCRLQILETYFKEICEVQGQIEKLNPADSSRSDLEEVFITAKAKLLSNLNKSRCSTSAEQSFLNASISAAPHQSRLPSLKLPKFDGKYADYKRFISTFQNMVHDNSMLTPVDKFNYLLSCLSGPALAVVEPFLVTDENYPKALERLKERYDNKVLIFLEHITALFNVSQMSKGDCVSLRNIIDTVSAIRGSLLSLGSEMDVMNAIIIHMVLLKLDEGSRQNYDEKQEFKSLPTWDTCYNILSNRCQFLESHGKKCEPVHKPSGSKPKPNFNRSANTFVNSKTDVTCSYCSSADHYISTCSSFLSLVVSERFNFVKRNGHCINCLRKGHLVSKCPSKSRCRVCHAAHHTNLHIYAVSDNTAPPLSNGALNQAPSSSQGNPVSLVARSCKRAILPTAVVLIKDNFGSFIPVRVLLDSCSEINFITEEVAKRLKLQFQPEAQGVSGIGEIQTSSKFSVAATIKSRVSSFEWSSVFAVSKSISAQQPGEFIETSDWKIPETIQLADPLFYKPQRIDLLLNSEVFFAMLLNGRISLGDNKPCLVNTVFGWIVGGKFTSQTTSSPLTCNLALYSSTETLDNTLKKFWEVEEYASGSEIHSEEEQLCEQHFVDNVNVNADGRIQVRLPFKLNADCLGESFEIARRRFLLLERRLERDSNLKSMYVDFMNEYISLGHMSPYDQPVALPYYIIPHHCVLKPQSTTTKLRVVFDASARTASNHSLNELLMVGPTIQQDLITTLFSFRLNRFALTADISKMYRQFLVDQRDRKFQLILWRANKEEKLKIFQLNTVTYGLSAAPFLAIRSLFYIADQNKSLYPVGSQVLREDLYVDDVLTGSNNFEVLNSKKNEIIKILSLHGLQLAKWNSNCPELVSNSDEEVTIKTGENDVTKTLGMSWNPKKDNFLFRFDLPDVICPTKRSVLSIVARIFDLLGLLSPIVIRCKMLLQEMWVQNISWDEPLNSNLTKLWLQIKEDLSNIQNIQVPRYVLTSENSLGEIHGFADASQRAFGCCLYYRVFVNGSYRTTLLISKSKVAPIKAQSLPRLELCAAVLLSKTWSKIKSKIIKFVSSIFFWTDSKIVLQWLKLHASTLNCFVGNRISELQEQTRDIQWRHVPSKSNPADIVSRGCSAAELPSTIWFNGPHFLCKEISDWPANLVDNEIEILERRKAAVFKCTTNDSPAIIDIIIDKHSSYYKIIRILTYVFRIFNRSPLDRSLKAKDIIHLQATELETTFWRIVSHIQQTNFTAEIEAISNNNLVQPSLQKLAPFLQDTKMHNKEIKLLRVGGRLSNAPIPYDARFPALLPKEHRFVKLYIEHLHRSHLHAGPKVLLGILRQKLWITNAREIVRKVVRNCVHCFHYKPKLMGQIMGNLPVDRLRAQRPFLVTGVDFCGPFLTSYRIRGKVPYKTYIAVFVCFGSKATHLELVSDLSTNNFLLCLKRFIGRRGIPQRIFCDNATNFTGAHNKLKEIKQKMFSDDVISKLKTFCTQSGFEFCFIPPRAPHFGGLWEAAVKSAKTLLLKNVSEAHLTFEELQTLIVEVEAVLNSRPIAPMSDDPNDGEALTPGHLLIGSALISIPDETFDCSKVPVLSRWQQISFLKQQFWQMWSRDYVLSLQQRSKWFKPQPNIKAGQLVIIHEDNTPPQQWPLARVTQAIAGSDGKIRVVDLKSTNGSFRRPIHKLAPLPSQEDS